MNAELKVLGKFQWLINGDAAEELKKLPSNYIDLLVTDPPYKTTKRGSYSGTGGFFKKDEYNNGNGGLKHNNINPDEYLPDLYRIMKESAHGYLMCSDKTLIMFSNAIEKAGFKIIRNLVWVKNNCITGTFYMSNHEYIIFFRKGKGVKINNCGTKTVLHFDNPRPKIHPNQKPVDLLKILIENSSKKGDKVIDPFFGSGSTLVACKLLGRGFVGIEIDEYDYKLTQERVDSISFTKSQLDKQS